MQTVSRTSPKQDIAAHLAAAAALDGVSLSRSRALKLAERAKRGLFDPELSRWLPYADPTGEQAVRNIINSSEPRHRRGSFHERRA